MLLSNTVIVFAAAVDRRCSVKKVFLKISQNSQENTCASVSFSKVTDLRPKLQTLLQEFSCEFCEIYKNTFFTEHLWATASVSNVIFCWQKWLSLT